MNDNNPTPNYAKAIRILMEERDITIGDVIDRTGMSAATVSRMRTGKTLNPPMKVVALWASALGVDTSELVRRAEEYGVTVDRHGLKPHGYEAGKSVETD